MAKYEIQSTCGHTWTTNLIGKQDLRYKKIAWLSERVCPDCYKIQLAKTRSEQTTKAAEVAKETGLPTLVGSEKQIAWAETIRRDQLDWVSKAKGRVAEHPDRVAALEDLRATLVVQTSAAAWINRRSRDLGEECTALIRSKKAQTETIKQNEKI